MKRQYRSEHWKIADRFLQPIRGEVEIMRMIVGKYHHLTRVHAKKQIEEGFDPCREPGVKQD